MTKEQAENLLAVVSKLMREGEDVLHAHRTVEAIQDKQLTALSLKRVEDWRDKVLHEIVAEINAY